MNKHHIKRAILQLYAIILLTTIIPVGHAQTTHDALLDTFILFPGDSRTVEFLYNDILPNFESMHVALISTFAPDLEIHQLRVQISPRGDIGPEFGYFTWGVFFSFTGGTFDFVEMLDPKFTYGFEGVSYLVTINPYMSLGLILSAATTKFSHVDFPVEMSMTLTLSN